MREWNVFLIQEGKAVSVHGMRAGKTLFEPPGCRTSGNRRCEREAVRVGRPRSLRQVTEESKTGASPDLPGGDEPITAEGIEALRAERDELEGPGRREMAKRIKAARELGDLKGERRVPHRQGRPGASRDTNQATPGAPRQRRWWWRRIRARASSHSAGPLRSGRGERPDEHLDAGRRDGGRPQAGEALGGVAGGAGAAGCAGRRRRRVRDAGRRQDLPGRGLLD